MTKSILFLFIVLLLSCKTTKAPKTTFKVIKLDTQKYSTLVKEAYKLYIQKDYINSAKKYKEAFIISFDKVNSYDRYNAACSYSMAKNIEFAFYHLFISIKATNYSNLNHITTDSDLNFLHKDKRWNELITIVKNNKDRETLFKNKLFLGAEIGLNRFITDNYKKDNSFQGGVSLEYYFSRNFSLSIKYKSYKTGAYFDRNAYPSNERYSGLYLGKIIVIPIFAKGHFDIYNKFRGNVKIGLGYNKETDSQYLNYTTNLDTSRYKDQYISVNFGTGLNYFINSKSAIYLDFDFNYGNNKGSTLEEASSYNQNIIFSLGYKYSFPFN